MLMYQCSEQQWVILSNAYFNDCPANWSLEHCRRGSLTMRPLVYITIVTHMNIVNTTVCKRYMPTLHIYVVFDIFTLMQSIYSIVNYVYQYDNT